MHIAFNIHGSVESLIDRRDVGREWSEVGFFHQKGLLRAHAQRAFHFAIGYLNTPFPGLAIHVMPVAKGSSHKEISFYIREVSLYPGLSVCVAYPVRDKFYSIHLAKMFHLRCYLSLRTAAAGDYNRGVINDALSAETLHKKESLTEKTLGLKAGKGRVVLDKKFSGIGQHQTCTLRLDSLFSNEESMGGCVMLHLLARGKRITPGSVFCLS